METTTDQIKQNAANMQPLFNKREDLIMKIKHITNSCLLYSSNNITFFNTMIDHSTRKAIAENMRALSSLCETYHKVIADLIVIEQQITQAIEYKKRVPVNINKAFS
jgi:hypothetical protein